MEGYFGEDEPVEIDIAVEPDEEEPEDHGYTYARQLLDLDMEIAHCGRFEADLFADAYCRREDVKLGKEQISVGEVYTPVTIRLDERTGEMVFWFYKVDTDLPEEQQDILTLYGLTFEHLYDVFPEFHNHLALFQKEKGALPPRVLNRANRRVIGSRRRIIESLNNSIETRCLQTEEERTKRLAEAKKDFYGADDNSGMF